MHIHYILLVAALTLGLSSAHAEDLQDGNPEQIVETVGTELETTAEVAVPDDMAETPVAKKKGFWDKGVGKLLKRIDQWMEDGQTAGIDTMYQTIPKLNRQVYLGAYAYMQRYSMNLPYHIDNIGNGYYKPKIHCTQGDLEVGIDWKGLSLFIPIPLTSGYAHSFGLAKNGSVWGFRIRYKQMKDIFGDIDTGMDYIDGSASDKSAELFSPENAGQHTIRTFFAEGYYVLNHKKFSLGAGLFADMVQKKSAGGFLIYANYFQSRYSVDDFLWLNDYDSFRTQQASIGAGYGYNWAFKRGKIVLHASAVPMLTAYSHLVHKSHTALTEDVSWKEDLVKELEIDRGENVEKFKNYINPLTKSDVRSTVFDAADNGRAHFRVNAFARIAANYSFDRYILTFLMNYRYYGYSNNKQLQIHNHDLDAQLNFCVRF